MRESLREDCARLVKELDPQGDPSLREAIAGYLAEYRGMRVNPARVVLGAGTAYLLGMLIEILPGARFAIENPGYPMIARTLRSRNVRFDIMPVDGQGASFGRRRKNAVSVCCLTPSNQFPLGTVMSIGRRTQFLDWAAERAGRYLVEDDYDSDYRYALRPPPALHALDCNERVVYLNTFARTLAPSLRIAYLVLPERLMKSYLARKEFYSSTVSGFEQRTLWRFIRGGHYERHLSRMRTLYRKRRDVLAAGLSDLSGGLAVSGLNSGLHLLLRSLRGLSESELVARAKRRKVRVYGLSGFFCGPGQETATVVAGYGGLSERELNDHRLKPVGSICD